MSSSPRTIPLQKVTAAPNTHHRCVKHGGGARCAALFACYEERVMVCIRGVSKDHR